MDREDFLARFSEDYNYVDDRYYNREYILELLEDIGFDIHDVNRIEELDRDIEIFIARRLFILISNYLFTSDDDLESVLEDFDDDWLENLVSIQNWNIVYLDIKNFKNLAQEMLEEANVKFTECEYNPYHISYICTQELGGIFCKVNER